VPADPRPPESSLPDHCQADSAGESHASRAESGSEPAQNGVCRAPTQSDSWLAGSAPVILWFLALIAASALLAWGLQSAGKRLIGSLHAQRQARTSLTRARTSGPTAQSEAEGLLARVAAGDSVAAEQVLAQSESWIGKTRRTPRANQLITVALDRHDMHVRQAALQADLVMDGIPRNATGLNLLKTAVETHDQRAWALWSLGGLGNRGVDPEQAAEIIESYLGDPDTRVRMAAVNGLAILGTDRTIPVLLDRFRNDPSALVQEQAACGLAESGMYTHVQRMVAAGNLVSWLNDSQLTAEQRTWTVHALDDISGQNLGMDPTAWQHWYENSR
jgi:HEAT repeats